MVVVEVVVLVIGGIVVVVVVVGPAVVLDVVEVQVQLYVFRVYVVVLGVNLPAKSSIEIVTVYKLLQILGSSKRKYRALSMTLKYIASFPYNLII
jgi:hypothetical protein